MAAPVLTVRFLRVAAEDASRRYIRNPMSGVAEPLHRAWLTPAGRCAGAPQLHGFGLVLAFAGCLCKSRRHGNCGFFASTRLALCAEGLMMAVFRF